MVDSTKQIFTFINKAYELRSKVLSDTELFQHIAELQKHFHF